MPVKAKLMLRTADAIFEAERRRQLSRMMARQSRSGVHEVRVGEIGMQSPISQCEIWASRSSLFAKYPSIP
jgi:hypothetical protein